MSSFALMDDVAAPPDKMFRIGVRIGTWNRLADRFSRTRRGITSNSGRRPRNAFECADGYEKLAGLFGKHQKRLPVPGARNEFCLFPVRVATPPIRAAPAISVAFSRPPRHIAAYSARTRSKPRHVESFTLTAVERDIVAEGGGSANTINTIGMSGAL